MPILRWFGSTKVRLVESKTVLPRKLILPPWGRSRPATQRSVVVLPQPDGPRRVKNSPCLSEKLISSTALTGWLPRTLKSLVRF